MIRTFNSIVVNFFIGEGDASALVEDHRNVCLVSEGGGFIFAWRGPGVYEAHSFFLPTHRGKFAIRAGREALEMLHDEYGAEKIWGLTPLNNRAALFYNRLCGMKSLSEIETPEGRRELFVKVF